MLAAMFASGELDSSIECVAQSGLLQVSSAQMWLAAHPTFDAWTPVW